jgi:hypothetical protein
MRPCIVIDVCLQYYPDVISGKNMKRENGENGKEKGRKRKEKQKN